MDFCDGSLLDGLLLDHRSCSGKEMAIYLLKSCVFCLTKRTHFHLQQESPDLAISSRTNLFEHHGQYISLCSRPPGESFLLTFLAGSLHPTTRGQIPNRGHEIEKGFDAIR